MIRRSILDKHIYARFQPPISAFQPVKGLTRQIQHTATFNTFKGFFVDTADINFQPVKELTEEMQQTSTFNQSKSLLRRCNRHQLSTSQRAYWVDTTDIYY
jgi:ABC-type antimicrobial peptide transport system ATPase subunit